MSEPRPTYGPPPPTYRTVATYQIVTGGEVTNCAGTLAVEARDALDAADQALAGPHQVINLVLQVSIDV